MTSENSEMFGKDAKCERLCEIGRGVSMRSDNSETLGKCDVSDSLKHAKYQRLCKIGRNSSPYNRGSNIFSSDPSNFGQKMGTTLRFQAVPVTHTVECVRSLPKIMVLHGITPDVSTYKNDVVSGENENGWDSMDNAILPGLSDEVAKYCLALVPGLNIPTMAAVCKKWRSYVKSRELTSMRKLGGVMEERVYALGGFGDMAGENHFGAVHVDGKLIVMGGKNGEAVLSDVYQYDCRLCIWSKLASMNVGRFDFACAEVNGIVYVAGGVGIDNEPLSSVEAYDAGEKKWMMMRSGLRYGRSGCIGSSLDGKLYVMGGTGTGTGDATVEIYDPKRDAWHETVHEHTKYCGYQKVSAVMEGKLYMLGEANEKRVLRVFNARHNSWEVVPIPIRSSFRKFEWASSDEWVGTLNGNVLVFLKHNTLLLCYDPNASPRRQWHPYNIKPSPLCDRQCRLRNFFFPVTGRP